jgi:hypothetical protein
MPPHGPNGASVPVCIVAAHDEADQLADMALAQESGARLIPW